MKLVFGITLIKLIHNSMLKMTEVLLAHFIQQVFIRPKKRPYKTDNYYAALMRQAAAEKEVDRIVRTSMEKE